MNQIRKVLSSPAGEELRIFLLKKLGEMTYITSVGEKDDPIEQAIEIKAQKRAHKKLLEIYQEIMDLSKEQRVISEKDSFKM